MVITRTFADFRKMARSESRSAENGNLIGRPDARKKCPSNYDFYGEIGRRYMHQLVRRFCMRISGKEDKQKWSRTTAKKWVPPHPVFDIEIFAKLIDAFLRAFLHKFRSSYKFTCRLPFKKKTRN